MDRKYEELMARYRRARDQGIDSFALRFAKSELDEYEKNREFGSDRNSREALENAEIALRNAGV